MDVRMTYLDEFSDLYLIISIFHDISRFYFAFFPKLAIWQAESLVFALDFATLGGTGGQHVWPTEGMAPHGSGSHFGHLRCFFKVRMFGRSISKRIAAQNSQVRVPV